MFDLGTGYAGAVIADLDDGHPRGCVCSKFDRDLNIGSLKTTLIEHIDERTHDAEARLLRAFADYNTNSDTRFRKLEADASNLNTSSTIRLPSVKCPAAAPALGQAVHAQSMSRVALAAQ